MTLSHTTELVRIWQKGYLWSRHCDKGEREGEANPSKHSSDPISSEELCRQETQSPIPFPPHCTAVASIKGVEHHPALFFPSVPSNPHRAHLPLPLGLWSAPATAPSTLLTASRAAITADFPLLGVPRPRAALSSK
jgi:hypothetical protein